MRRAADHRGRDVDADGVRAQRGGRGGEVARAAPDVEHLHPRAHLRGGEQRPAHARGHRRQERVRIRARLPAGRLEAVEGLRVDVDGGSGVARRTGAPGSLPPSG